MKKWNHHSLWQASGAAMIIAAMTWGGSNCQAFVFYEKDNLKAVLDSTVTYGLMGRIADRDPEQIGTGNGGKGTTTNWDDGDLNYDKGIVSNQMRITSDLDVSMKNFGLFLRGTAFYDYETMEGNRERTELGDGANDQQGRDIELLDAYIWGATHLRSIPIQIRLGEQVVNWGESTFILGGLGLNTFNPINVGKLRSPGASLKEALTPEGMLSLSASFTDNLSMEGVYIYDWEETQFDEPGTYFSTIDFVGRDGYKVIAAVGAPDNGLASVADTPFSLPRADDLEADAQGQFGLAARYNVSWLNDIEFGLYYMRYHSKTPTLSFRTGGQQAMDDFSAAVAADPNMLFPAFSTYLKDTAYRAEYAEDIDTLGMSFSTEVFGFGFQGEASYRKDVPLQIDDVELLYALAGSVMPGVNLANQVGSFLGEDYTWINGYIKRDTSQIQFTLSKLLGPVFGANGAVVLGELAWMHVYDMPDKDELRLETFGPYGSGNTILGPSFGMVYEPDNHYPDADSLGYVLFGQLDYNNLIGSVVVSPHVAWSHDFYGISPNGGPFLEGRKAVTIGFEFKYLKNISADISYTNYFGAGKLNQINDRDMIALNIKYSF